LYRGIDGQFQVIGSYIALRAVEAGLDLSHGEGNQFVSEQPSSIGKRVATFSVFTDFKG
jgi:hypothetical protein